MADQVLEAPRGTYPARCDDKGRLKLPVPFQQYLSALPEKGLFVTSMDRATARLYPLPVWRETEKRLDGATGEQAKRAKRVKFTARDLGADAEMDGQGRVLLPPELRRQLGIENQSVRIFAEKGRIEVWSEARYAERQQEAANTAPEDAEELETAGLV